MAAPIAAPVVVPKSNPPGATSLSAGLLYYYLTSQLVVLGIILSHDFFGQSPGIRSEERNLLRSFVRWDGTWFERIASEGYSYVPNKQSRVSFFPAYPLLGWVVCRLSGHSPAVALLFVSHLSLAGTFVLMAAYVNRRLQGTQTQLSGYVLLVLGLLPNTYILRLVYSESLFLFLTVLALYALERRLSLLIIALVVGLATATRPVGVGLLAPFSLSLWHRSRTAKEFLINIGLFLPLACWGIAAYMGYLYLEFDEPLGFAKSQLNWSIRPPVRFVDRLIALGELEPIRSVFTISSAGYWEFLEPHGNPLFSLCVANPLFFLVTVALTALGACKRWLSPYELLLAVSLLLIYYLTRGYDYMAGASRTTSVVFPIYLVLGNLLCRVPGPVAAAVLSLSGFLLAVYAAVFASASNYLLI